MEHDTSSKLSSRPIRSRNNDKEISQVGCLLLRLLVRLADQ